MSNKEIFQNKDFLDGNGVAGQLTTPLRGSGRALSCSWRGWMLARVSPRSISGKCSAIDTASAACQKKRRGTHRRLLLPSLSLHSSLLAMTYKGSREEHGVIKTQWGAYRRSRDGCRTLAYAAHQLASDGNGGTFFSICDQPQQPCTTYPLEIAFGLVLRGSRQRQWWRVKRVGSQT